MQLALFVVERIEVVRDHDARHRPGLHHCRGRDDPALKFEPKGRDSDDTLYTAQQQGGPESMSTGPDFSNGPVPSRSFGERLLGALRVDATIYEEVEHTPEALGQAAAVVALAAAADSSHARHHRARAPRARPRRPPRPTPRLAI